MNPESGFRIAPITIFRHDVIIKFFWRCFIFLVKFSYWSKFHVNVITVSGVMTISFYKGLTRNLEIGNTPVWVLPNIHRLGWVRNTKFGTIISNKMLLNPAKCQGYSLYRFGVIKGKPTGKGGGGVKLPPTQIRVNTARKTTFPRSLNIMESSKRPSKYHLSINFLAQNMSVFPISETFKTRTF